MKLNRNNYEEYFILYMDNELNDEDRRQVEIFVQENADLKAELDMLLQSKLVPDADISFNNKEMLMTKGSSISITNYEGWLLSYIDNELTAEGRNEVEKFVIANPLIQREFNLLQQTKLQPEEIIFPHKESLYRREEKARIVSIRWWRVAAAAVLLLGISITTIILVNKKSGNEQDRIVDLQPKEEQPTNPVKPSIMEIPASELKIAIEASRKKDHDAIVVKQKNITRKEKDKKPLQEKKEEPIIAKNDKEKQPSNNLPQLTKDNPYLTNEIESNNTVAKTDHKESLTNQKEIADNSSVTSEPTDTYQEGMTSDIPNKNPDVIYASNSEKKNKLRGFFRKVTRTFEKRTNIQATDEDDRLLIAGLAIKLN